MFVENRKLLFSCHQIVITSYNHIINEEKELVRESEGRGGGGGKSSPGITGLNEEPPKMEWFHVNLKLNKLKSCPILTVPIIKRTNVRTTKNFPEE